MRSPSEQIEQLRATRGWRDHDVALGPLVESLAVSRELAGRTRVTAIRGGVVHVAADSASTVYELDRLLRGGLEQEIRRRYQATLTRIKVTVGRV
jgi:hypothetical protein